ncbi:MAG: hypothetical protein AAGG11_17915 [Pseudomonadota bacterium]
MKLSEAGFCRARDGIFEHGRKLERLRFEHCFEHAGREAATAELATYQNPDGGFGNGIEPDFWLPDSSPMATTVGLQVARELGLDAGHPIVDAALDYLSLTFAADLRGWYAVPRTVNDYPHAPWWHRQPGVEPDPHALRLNPGAEIVGYLLSWGRGDFREWVADLVDGAGVLESHQLLCCLRLADAPGLDKTNREAVLELIRRSAPAAIETDPSRWAGYCLKPLAAVPKPDALLFEAFADPIAVQLDYEIEQQCEATGLWLPHWSWLTSYPESWSLAKLRWAGIITLDTLRSLGHYDRIE